MQIALEKVGPCKIYLRPTFYCGWLVFSNVVAFTICLKIVLQGGEFRLARPLDCAECSAPMYEPGRLKL